MTAPTPVGTPVSARHGARAEHIAAGGEMRCGCGGGLSSVKDSRPTVFGAKDEPTIRRMRLCDKCGNRTATLEVRQDFLTDFRADVLREIAILIISGGLK